MNKKRILSIFLCLALLCPCALAAPGDRSLLSRDDFFSDHSGFPSGGCVCGGALCLYTDSQLYVLRVGDDLPAAIELPVNSSAVPNEDGDIIFRRLEQLFSDGERLLALVGVYGFEDGEALGMTSLEVAKVQIDGETANLVPVSELDPSELGVDGNSADYNPSVALDPADLSVDYGYGAGLSSVNAAVHAGGRLFLDIFDESYERQLCCVDLEGGESEYVDVDNLAGIAPYDGERLLVETFDRDAGRVEFLLLDPEGDALTSVCAPFAAQSPIQCFAWSVESGRLFWLDAGYVMAAEGFDVASAAPMAEVAARFPSEDEAFLLPGDVYALAGEYDGLFLRETGPDALPDARIVVQSGGIFPAMTSGYYDFNARHSDAKVVLREVYDESTILADILSRDDSVDVRCTMASDETFAALRERGLLAPITDAGLIGAVSKLDPAVRDALTLDGELIAVPVYAAGWTLGLDYEGFAHIGIPEEDIPDNWPEFLDLLPTLPEHLDEDGRVRIFPEYVTQPQLRAELVKLILDSWLLYLRASGEELRYDDHDLRTALEKAMALDLDALGVQSGNDDTYAMVAVASGGGSVPGERSYTLVNTNADCTLSGMSYERPAALSVIPGTQTPLPLDVAVLYINPYSKHRELAQEYLADVYANLDAAELYDLGGADMQPMEEPGYAEEIAEAEDAVKKAQAKLDAASEEDAPRWEEALAEEEEERDYIEANRWRISAEQIEWYREHVQERMVRSYSYADPSDTSGEFYGLVKQYLDGTTDTAAFLKEIDRRVQMKAREG